MRETKSLLILMAGTLLAWGQQLPPSPDAVTLGRLSDGSLVTFHPGAGGWGIQISGPERFSRKQPVSIELYRGDVDIEQLDAGYQSVTVVAARQVLARAPTYAPGHVNLGLCLDEQPGRDRGQQPVWQLHHAVSHGTRHKRSSNNLLGNSRILR